jgi:hypothetical protein
MRRSDLAAVSVISITTPSGFESLEEDDLRDVIRQQGVISHGH